jgi:hypothetical protein
MEGFNMSYMHGFTTAQDILKDLAKTLTTGGANFGGVADNWTIFTPATVEEITDEVVFKLNTVTDKVWVKRELISAVATGGIITVSKDILGSVRVLIVDGAKKFYLYRLKNDMGDPGVFEYKVDSADKTKIIVNDALVGKKAYIDYEKVFEAGDFSINGLSATANEFFIKLNKPAKSINYPLQDNHYYITWQIGTDYDESTGFPTDKSSIPSTLSWFRDAAGSSDIAKEWLPIEYWISFDKSSAVGVIMGDPGLSEDYYLSSPFYFGKLDQIDGALNTDLRGNFGGFAGTYYEPNLYTDANGTPNPVYKTYGDYTGNGGTDMIMAYSKTGRPYNMHKFAIFGAYEFREKTFNGQSAHTGKHSVSEVIVGDVNENDRGKLRRCLASPKVGKEHCTELIYNRYMSGEEETYIFLHINVPYTPINTSSDVLLGIAIRTDI